jgi:hypothetical protein
VDLHYNQEHSYKDISNVLKIIQDNIRNNRFSISKNENRQENIDFIYEYKLTSKKQKDILLRIKPEDFCHSLRNLNPGYEYETLYVFCYRCKLFNSEMDESVVDIYIKINILEFDKGIQIIVISFHKRNKPISYCFGDRR